MPKRSFDQGKYWSARGDRYREEFAGHAESTSRQFQQQERELDAILSTYDFSGVRSMLEIGCGFGRLSPIILRHLPDVERYVGLDVSAGQVEATREASASWSVPSVEVRQADFRRMEPEDRFDLVFAGEVFLHFPPDEIVDVLRSALSLATQWLLHVDPYAPKITMNPLQRARWLVARARTGQPLTETNWVHEYPRVYASSTVTMHPILGTAQHLFVLRQPSPSTDR